MPSVVTAWPDKLGTDLIAVGGMYGRRRGKVEEGKEAVSKHHIHLEWVWRTSGLTRDGMATPVSRDLYIRRIQGQLKITLPVQLITSRIGNQTGQCLLFYCTCTELA